MSEPAEQRVPRDPAELEDFHLTDFVPYLLNQAMSRLDINLRVALKPFDLTIHQWRVMFMIQLNGPSSIGDISDRTVMGQSTITRVADQLEAAGLASRQPLENNHRVVLLALTESGKELIRNVIPHTFAIHDGAVEGLDSAEQRQMFELLRKLAANLRRHEARQKFESV